MLRINLHMLYIHFIKFNLNLKEFQESINYFKHYQANKIQYFDEWLVFFLGKVNNVELWGADIGNAYLEALTEEKLYIVPGPEF